jgi:hypothetical protein
MTWLALGVLAQVLASAVVGLRLLWLARRTRKLPELTFGLCFLLLGAFGLPLTLAARGDLAPGPEAAGLLLAGGFLAQNAACLALAVNTWRTFRPEGRAGLLAVVAVGTAFTVSLAGQALTVGFRGAADGGDFYVLGFLARMGTFVWASAEAVRYWALLRRRLVLGLADPVIVNRLALWSAGALAVVVGFAAFGLARLAEVNPATSPAVLATSSLAGLVAGVALWLAFAPPAAYLRRVTARARA